MANTSDTPSASSGNQKQGRRDFLFLFPLAAFAGMAASVAAAAYRFLRPPATTGSDAVWTDVAPVSGLAVTKPQPRRIGVALDAGWATVMEDRLVYVLPGGGVLSSVCPHENCDVAWRDESNRFFCPCHDSVFMADGARVSGPARRGLDPLPSRVRDGILQVQYLTYVNNTEQRVVRQ